MTAVYFLDMSETAVICLDDAVRRELAVARAKHGNSWEVQSIANSWGDIMDDRETLGAIHLFDRTGSVFAGVICSIH
ncbi:hypothetical protein EN858_29950 [Mesorhizobium sp. M4B.F.Ca.ET.215.01.1.1]|uniref:hypothetical protein n=1 Tax=unclassified Mesorhizobium TaxID=325217 RepID=UPI000FE4D9BD|nr:MULTISPECIES: hypothetical protein [unclassified Mesorhizobium]RWC82922.1 MAG: hypothetical protein EOS31_14290 [Mesorhizobium sp.]TGQ05237.1 hypothetical protein EN858_29950 [Mesorhizobium sp. M4B.F.Ca.ET.215.01.1.1]TGQ30542.1 hypothetical protein EN863_040800 [Mesorhizobium sp. M00.F.Ca.ET.220.01.1.1]TGQ97783.1 hypothetical protein EN846_28190 [Mesorhizobium sp. M4B.F.Ca.ET.203.01.1.1]TIV38417.1 MAG: hypothetical protein E5V91_14835 [Mesorhizobium sp.]